VTGDYDVRLGFILDSCGPSLPSSVYECEEFSLPFVVVVLSSFFEVWIWVCFSESRGRLRNLRSVSSLETCVLIFP